MAAAPAYRYAASLVRVIDGDTLELDVDLGFWVRLRVPVRLAGLNAPERNTAKGRDARAFVEAWCQSHGPFTLETAKGPDKYGRLLATVADARTGSNLNATLLGAGLAVEWNGKGPAPVPT